VIHFHSHDIDAIADAIIHSICEIEAEDPLRKAISPDGERKPVRIAHAAYFDAEFKRLGPYERRWKSMLRAIWAAEQAIILANLKKLKKYRACDGIPPGIRKIRTGASNIVAGGKGISDNIMYPQVPFKSRLSKETKKILTAMLADLGQGKLDDLDMHIVFDVTNPRVKQWIEDYTFKFSENLEVVNSEKLRVILDTGFEQGKTIPELMAEVKQCFDSWDTYRAEIISRTETSRASNESAIEAYRQSGVVEQKQWLTAPDCCDICAEMDGEVVALEEPFFDDDYGDGMAPPKHPNCRCSVVAFIES